MIKKVLNLLAVSTIILIFPSGVTGAEEMLDQWRQFSRGTEADRLILWLRCHAKARLTGATCREKGIDRHPDFYGKYGIFITLRKGNKTRGCFGAFSHASVRLDTVLLDYLDGALRRDPRYKSLDVSELDATSIIITVTSQPVPVDDIYSVDTMRFGIVISCDENGERVIVPAEIRSTDYILRTNKTKGCQISAFQAVTIK